MTNGNKIRNMNNQELAKLIISGEWSCICRFCKYYGTLQCRYDEEDNDSGDKEYCEKGALEFLESEVKN